LRRRRARSRAHELRARVAAVREAGLPRRHDPGDADGQAKDGQGAARRTSPTGRRGMGRRGEESECRASRRLHDPDIGATKGGVGGLRSLACSAVFVLMVSAAKGAPQTATHAARTRIPAELLIGALATPGGLLAGSLLSGEGWRQPYRASL